jgi:hypothetical protein
MASNDVRAAAMALLAHGWSLLPLRAGEKRPLLKWEALQQQAAGKTEVRRWFERWPDANIGVVSGAVSGLIILDIDPRHGGEESLARIEKRQGATPPTVESATGGGGRHLYFRHPGGTVHNRVNLRPGMDLRGDGGYVVAPPSLHPSGKRYAWAPGRNPDEISPAPPPAWLKRLIASDGDQQGHTMAYWRGLARDGVREGARNNTIASFTGHLLWHGIDPDVAMELMLCWNQTRCRPPLPTDEVINVVNSISRLHRQHDHD